MKDQTKKICIFASALLVAIIASIAVFAVADYDSASDPLISRSFLIKYINDNVKTETNSKFEIIDNKLKDLEEMLGLLVGETNPPSDGTGSGSGSSSNENTLALILRLTERITAVEEKLTSLNSEHTALSGKYDEIKLENSSLKTQIEDIKKQFNEFVNDNGKDDVTELQDKYNSLASELASLKKSTNTIKESFTDITASYVSLQKEVYNLNDTLKQLSDSDSSVLKDLLNLSAKMTEFGTQLNELMTKNMSFELVRLEKGDKILAKGSVSLMLQYGEATSVSPKSEAGTSMDYTDLTSGNMIYDGEKLPLNHNIFIPGNGRTAVLATGEHGIYVFVGGDYEIVKASDETPETGNGDVTGETGSGAVTNGASGESTPPAQGTGTPSESESTATSGTEGGTNA